MRPRSAPGDVVDLADERGRGPLWGIASDDLNATLLHWGPGDGTPEHVNEERDVLLVALAGSGTVSIDGVEHPIRAQATVIVPKRSSRRILAGEDGLRYLSVHLRRPGLQVERLGRDPPPA